ncbi:hypothetical protein A1F94_005094 [Pyrenophora tritici-repentis]|nr:hypothetical protein A1F94_005094 [Pyrenophora tritici-repentis]
MPLYASPEYAWATILRPRLRPYTDARERRRRFTVHLYNVGREPTIALDDVLLELCLSDPRLRDVKTALASNDRRIPHYLIAEGIRMELADLEASNDGKLFIGNGRLVVPFSEKLRTRIIAHIHNSLPGGHGGRTTTYQQVSQWYYWQGMTNTIARLPTTV